MTVRNDVPKTGRDIFVHPAGVSGRPAITNELAVPTLAEAEGLLAALDPPPSGTLPASLSVVVTGTFFVAATVPQYVSGNMRFASILTGDPVNLTFGGNQTIEIGSLLNFSGGGVCARIDGKVRTRGVINSVVPAGSGGVGVEVSGECDEIFIELVEGVLLGESAVMLKHVATSPTPIEYDVGVVTFSAPGQALIEYNPPPGSTETILNISAAQFSATVEQAAATGATVLRCLSGVLAVNAEVLEAEFVAVVAAGALAVVTAKAAIGSTTVAAGGTIVYQSVGRMVGDVEVQGVGAVAEVNTESLAGNFTVEDGGNATLKTDIIVGDIAVNPGGRMFLFADTHLGAITPSDPGDGRIDGIANGVRYGNWRVMYGIVLSAGSMLEQIPLGLGVALQVEFGTPFANDDVDLAADGTITALQIAQYTPEFMVSTGRAGSGGVAFLMFRVTVDGVQFGETLAVKLDGINDDVPVHVTPGAISLTPGQAIRLEVARRPGFMDDGSLMSTPSLIAGWGAVRSATVRVEVLR